MSPTRRARAAASVTAQEATGASHPVPGESPDPRRLRAHVEALAAGPRNDRHHPTGMAAAQRYIDQHLADAGWSVEHQDLELRWKLGVTDSSGPKPIWPIRLHRRLSGANILATRAGTQMPTVVIGAHLDSVKDSPGADDNASGIAVLLELATVLPVSAAVTLAFFDMEEVGHYGAAALARRVAADRSVTGMVCLEMVGYYTDEPQSQKLPLGAGRLMGAAGADVKAGGRRGDFLLVVHRRSSTELAQRAIAGAAAHGLTAVAVRDPRPEGRLNKLATLVIPPTANFDRSDHGRFWAQNIPAIMLTDTANLRNPHYHRPSDTPATLDYVRLAAVTAAAVSTCPVADVPSSSTAERNEQ